MQVWPLGEASYAIPHREFVVTFGVDDGAAGKDLEGNAERIIAGYEEALFVDAEVDFLVEDDEIEPT